MLASPTAWEYDPEADPDYVAPDVDSGDRDSDVDADAAGRGDGEETPAGNSRATFYRRKKQVVKDADEGLTAAEAM